MKPQVAAQNSDEALGGSERTKELFGASYEKLTVFAELLKDQGELRGLIGPDEASRLWDRHLLNSAALLQFLPERGAVADLGSGAGLPGVVLTIARPDLSFTLIEPLERRVDWLNEVLSALKLENARTVRARAEDLVDEMAFDAITARAVAPIGKLTTWALPLLKPNGYLLALKGKSAAAELEKATKQLRKLKVRAELFEKVAATTEATPTTIVKASRA